jgi:hypothetical protein
VCGVSTDLRLRGGAVAVLCGVQFVDVLGVTSATTAVPAMVRAVGAPPSAAALIITPYAALFGGLLVLGARLGDRFGHRRILLAGIGLFVIVSLVGSLSTGVVELMLTRAHGHRGRRHPRRRDHDIRGHRMGRRGAGRSGHRRLAGRQARMTGCYVRKFTRALLSSAGLSSAMWWPESIP